MSLILYPSGVLFLQCMLVAPAQPEAGNFTEAERARRKAEKELRKRGEVTDGIVELRVRPDLFNSLRLTGCNQGLTSPQMMSLEEESDDE